VTISCFSFIAWSVVRDRGIIGSARRRHSKRSANVGSIDRAARCAPAVLPKRRAAPTGTDATPVNEVNDCVDIARALWLGAPAAEMRPEGARGAHCRDRARGVTSPGVVAMRGRAVSESVTGWLKRWRAGEPEALERLLPLVYAELRQVAAAQMRRESASPTLQPTALVHEAYLKLVDASQVDWQDRAHFLATAARAMRQVLVEHARARGARKRDFGERLTPSSIDPPDP